MQYISRKKHVLQNPNLKGALCPPDYTLALGPGTVRPWAVVRLNFATISPCWRVSKTAKVGTRDHIQRLEKENPPPSSGWKEKWIRHMDLLEGRMAPGTTKMVLAAARMEPKTIKGGTRDHIQRLEKENPPPSSGCKEERVRRMDLLEGRMAPGIAKK